MSNFVKFYVIALAGTVIALAVSILMCITFNWNVISIICFALSIALLVFVNVMLYLEVRADRKTAEAKSDGRAAEEDKK